MEILVNGHPLEYELESECTLGEVIDSISHWLYQRGVVIVSVKLEGVSIDFADDEAVRARALSAIGKLEFESQNARVLVVETVNELSQYLDRVARLGPQMSDEELTDEAVGQLLDGLGWCLDVMKRVEDILQIRFSEITFEGETVHKHILRLGDVRDHLFEAQKSGNRDAMRAILRETLAPRCDIVVRSLPAIMEKTNLEQIGDDIEEELAKVSESIEGLPQRLEEIAIKISIGDTTKGMEEFAEAVGTLERAFSLIDLCRKRLSLSTELLIVEGRSFEDRSQGLSKILDELIHAFERKDRVLIGDLIEYEIAPETEALGAIIEQIRKEIKGSCH